MDENNKGGCKVPSAPDGANRTPTRLKTIMHNHLITSTIGIHPAKYILTNSKIKCKSVGNVKPCNDVGAGLVSC